MDNRSKKQKNQSREKNFEIETRNKQESLDILCTSKGSDKTCLNNDISSQISTEISKERKLNNKFCKVNEESCCLEKVTDKNEIPGLISAETSMDDGSVKSQVKTDSISSSTQIYKTIDTVDVIVANLHKEISIHYMLHLFNKYDPIAASLMKSTPQMSIRYCHVYFKTQEQAKQVEKEFDRFVLLDKSLIVLRSHKFEKALMYEEDLM